MKTVGKTQSKSQAQAKASTKKTGKQASSQSGPIRIVSQSDVPLAKDTASTLTSVESARFEVLWLQFEQEAGLTSQRLQQDRDKLLDDIAQLEEKIGEKQQQLAQLDGRVEAAKGQMRMLFEARLSDEAILTAMRVQYKVKRTSARAVKPKSEAQPVDDKDTLFVLEHLDAEGLSVADLKQITNKESRYLRTILEDLVKQGKVEKSGDRASARYHLIR